MKKFFYLATCSTCAKIMKELPLEKAGVELREIKSEAITPEELDAMQKLSGSYESLFSRVALKYRAWGLNEKKLTEKDYRKYILEEYTFLKRPVLLLDDRVLVGNKKATVAEMKEALS
jgi:arsenate reductase